MRGKEESDGKAGQFQFLTGIRKKKVTNGGKKRVFRPERKHTKLAQICINNNVNNNDLYIIYIHRVS